MDMIATTFDICEFLSRGGDRVQLGGLPVLSRLASPRRSDSWPNRVRMRSWDERHPLHRPGPVPLEQAWYRNDERGLRTPTSACKFLRLASRSHERQRAKVSSQDGACAADLAFHRIRPGRKHRWMFR